VHVAAYFLLAIYVVPPLLIVVFSFTSASAISTGNLAWDSFTLKNYALVFSDYEAFWPFLVSLGYGAFAALTVVAGMLFVARLLQKYRNRVTGFIEFVLHIPWVLPSTLIALGLILAYDHASWIMGNVVLTGTVALLGITYVILKIPFTLRMLKAAFTGVPDQLEEAAAILGAGPLTTFRLVLLPVVAPTAAAIAALNFNSLLDDYDTAVFVAHPLYQPLGIVIKNATGEDTLNDATALTFVYTVLLMLITATTMWLVYGRPTAGRRRRQATAAQPVSPAVEPVTTRN
jgi:iron(III) transport system permease protein